MRNRRIQNPLKSVTSLKPRLIIYYLQLSNIYRYSLLLPILQKTIEKIKIKPIQITTYIMFTN